MKMETWSLSRLNISISQYLINHNRFKESQTSDRCNSYTILYDQFDSILEHTKLWEPVITRFYRIARLRSTLSAFLRVDRSSAYEFIYIPILKMALSTFSSISNGTDQLSRRLTSLQESTNSIQWQTTYIPISKMVPNTLFDIKPNVSTLFDAPNDPEIPRGTGTRFNRESRVFPFEGIDTSGSLRCSNITRRNGNSI